MFDGIFGEMFDVDGSGSLDAFESALECMFIDEELMDGCEDYEDDDDFDC